MLKYPSKQSQITLVISFLILSFSKTAWEITIDETDTDPSGVISDTITSGNLNFSVTSFRHKLIIYILLTDCYTFLLISVLRI